MLKKSVIIIDNSWITDELLREYEIDIRVSTNIVKEVYKKLIEIAKKGERIFYEDIIDMAGLNIKDRYDREHVLGHMLGLISEHEHKCGRPMLSAVVVRKPTSDKPESMPGEGFFQLALELGLYDGSENLRNKKKFWFKEVGRVWDYWKKRKMDT